MTPTRDGKSTRCQRPPERMIRSGLEQEPAVRIDRRTDIGSQYLITAAPADSPAAVPISKAMSPRRSFPELTALSRAVGRDAETWLPHVARMSATFDAGTPSRSRR